MRGCRGGGPFCAFSLAVGCRAAECELECTRCGLALTMWCVCVCVQSARSSTCTRRPRSRSRPCSPSASPRSLPPPSCPSSLRPARIGQQRPAVEGMSGVRERSRALTCGGRWTGGVGGGGVAAGLAVLRGPRPAQRLHRQCKPNAAGGCVQFSNIGTASCVRELTCWDGAQADAFNSWNGNVAAALATGLGSTGDTSASHTTHNSIQVGAAHTAAALASQHRAQRRERERRGGGGVA